MGVREEAGESVGDLLLLIAGNERLSGCTAGIRSPLVRGATNWGVKEREGVT